MRIVVTGAAGFVGSHLLNRLGGLQAAGAEVVATAKSGFTDSSGLAFQSLDVGSRSDIDAFVKTVQPTHLVHLAGIPSIGAVRADPTAAWQVNVLGTLDLARAVLDHAPACTMIFAGSSECYGASALDGEPLSERHLLKPMNEYAATKCAADLALGALAASGLKVIRFRPFNHTGPGQTADFVIPAFANQIAKIEKGEQSPEIYVGNLNVARDFLDVRDVADAYIAAIAMSDKLDSGTIFNVASGRAQVIGDILNALLRKSDRKIEVIADPARQRAVDIPLSVGDASLAQNLLGWRPRIAFDQTLADVLQYFREQTATP